MPVLLWLKLPQQAANVHCVHLICPPPLPHRPSLHDTPHCIWALFSAYDGGFKLFQCSAGWPGKPLFLFPTIAMSPFLLTSLPPKTGFIKQLGSLTLMVCSFSTAPEPSAKQFYTMNALMICHSVNDYHCCPFCSLLLVSFAALVLCHLVFSSQDFLRFSGLIGVMCFLIVISWLHG